MMNVTDAIEELRSECPAVVDRLGVDLADPAVYELVSYLVKAVDRDGVYELQLQSLEERLERTRLKLDKANAGLTASEKQNGKLRAQLEETERRVKAEVEGNATSQSYLVERLRDEEDRRKAARRLEGFDDNLDERALDEVERLFE